MCIRDSPTTRAAIAKIKGIPLPPDKHDRLLCHNSRASNGAPMKVGLSLIHIYLVVKKIPDRSGGVDAVFEEDADRRGSHPIKVESL